MAIDRYCNICGNKFEPFYPLLNCCEGCAEKYLDQQLQIASEMLAPSFGQFMVTESNRRLFGARSEGYVYFIQNTGDGLIKIGATKDIGKRLSGLQVSASARLVLLAKECGGFKRERELHEKFSDYRKTGEWFEPVQEILDYIRNIGES